MTINILIADNVAKEAQLILDQDHDVLYEEISPKILLEIIPDYDAILVRSRTKVTAEVINAGKKLKVIGRAGIGVDNIDVKTATEKKIPVVFAPRGSTISVAEITVAQILALARNLIQADRSMKEGYWAKKQLMGIELAGKTVGLIGMGRIGIEVAKRCQAFDMHMIAFDPYIPVEMAQQHNIELKSEVKDIYTQSDFISIHALLTEETRGMVGAPEFELMKNTAYIINYSRGGIIDEKALVEALKSYKIAGAALDVFITEPLAPDSTLRSQIPNLHLSPHIGAATKEAQIKAGTITADQILKVLDKQIPEFVVNPVIFE